MKKSVLLLVPTLLMLAGVAAGHIVSPMLQDWYRSLGGYASEQDLWLIKIYGFLMGAIIGTTVGAAIYYILRK